MSSMIHDLKSEIITFIKGSTIDALIPPFVYVLVNQYTSITIAGISAIVIALYLFLRRMMRKEAIKYAIVGIVGVVFAFSLALYTKRASDFFIPQLLSSGIIIILIVYSLLVRKPFAAWLSHLSRGWSFNWFWRSDVKPAYTEVTFVWLLFMLVKFSIQYNLWKSGDVTTTFIITTLLGFPGITVVLMLTYIYGIVRLRKLKCPGVHEYLKDGPYEGQKKGF